MASGGLEARIALLDVDSEKLAAFAGELSRDGIVVESAMCDVTDAARFERAVEDLAARCGPVQHLFNNAGCQGALTSAHVYPVDDFERVIRINVTQIFVVLKAFAMHIFAACGRAIVNAASMAAFGSPSNMLAYATSKAALIGMTQTASKDLVRDGVRVNAISAALIGSGVLRTRQDKLQAAAGSQHFGPDTEVVARQVIDGVPMRRYSSLEEIPGTVAYLLSDSASYVTGINIPIAGGLLPGRS